jgi:hypothetical protein
MAVSVQRALLIAILSAAVVAAAGCGGGGSSASGTPQQGAGLFMSSLIREKATGQYDLAWESLHPLHQEVAPEKVYVRCENLTVFPGHLTKVSVVRVIDEPVLIAGEKERVPSKAVTLKVSVNSPGRRGRALDLAAHQGKLRAVQGRDVPRHRDADHQGVAGASYTYAAAATFGRTSRRKRPV